MAERLNGEVWTAGDLLERLERRDKFFVLAQGLRRLGYASANLKGGMKAWGEHYTTRALVEGPDLAIYQVRGE